MGAIETFSPGKVEAILGHHPLMTMFLTLLGDTGRWAVWLGRYPPKNASGGPKGWLKRVRTPLLSVRAKASLTLLPTKRNEEAKAGPNEPLCLTDGGQG